MRNEASRDEVLPPRIPWPESSVVAGGYRESSSLPSAIPMLVVFGRLSFQSVREKPLRGQRDDRLLFRNQESFPVTALDYGAMIFFFTA